MSNIWWSHISNASDFVDKVIKYASEGRATVLELPDYVPWRSAMDTCIEERLSYACSNRMLKKVYDNESKKPGECILLKFCKPEKRLEFRPAKGYANFLAEQTDITLNNRFVWIKVKNQERADAWLAFISEYQKALKKNGTTGGVFILEVKKLPQNIPTNLIIVSYDNNICDYDRYAFNILCAAGINENSNIKSYLSELVSNVVGNDIELSALCMKHEYYRDILNDTYEAIKRIIEENDRSDGNPFVFEKNRDQVNSGIWKTQIKTVFPVIEENRGRFVNRHSKEIEKQLPIKNDYGEEYCNPNDVEVGMLLHFISSGIIKTTPKENDLMKRLKEARNLLAHLNTIKFNDVEVIFNMEL